MRFLLVILAAMCLAGAFLCADASAHGGLVVQRIRQPLFRPRVTIVRQLAAPRAFVAPFVLQQQIAVPAFSSQAFFAPQAFVVPQAFAAPAVIVPHGSAAFFAY